MATRIPTIIAEGDISTGPVGPYASPQAFSGGAEGLDNLGAGIANMGESLAQIAAKQKHDDDVRWNSKATAQFDKEAINFINDPKNSGREDFADITFKFLDDQKKSYLKNAPSGRARQVFTQYADGFANRNRESVLKQGQRVKLENTKNEVATNVNDAMSAFRQTADTNLAALNAEAQLQNQHNSIDTIYSELSPATSRALHEYVDDQFIIGTAEKNPAYARKVLDGSEYIDQTRRKVLLNHIEDVESRVLHDTSVQFTREMDNKVKFGLRNLTLIPETPESAFIAILGKEKGHDAFVRHQVIRGESNSGIVLASSLAGKSPRAISRILSESDQNSSLPDSAKAFAHDHAGVLLRQIKANTAGYITQHNPTVRSAYADFIAAPPEMKAQAFQNYANISLHYQSQMPETVGPNQPNAGDWYLDLASNDRSILPEDMADEWRTQLTRGSGTERFQALNGFAQLFANYEHWNIGFNDLVNAPEGKKGIPIAYQMALQFARWDNGNVFISQPEVVQELFAAVDNEELLKEIGKDKEKYAEYERHLVTDDKWQKWSTAVLMNTRRAGDVAAAKSAIIAYAWNNRSLTPSEAVRDSYQKLIGQHQFIGTINGKSLPMSRVRKDGGVRSDVEMEDLERRLGVAPKYLAVEQIDTDRIGLPSFLGSDSQENKLHLLRYVMANGFYQPEPDGNAATLHVTSENGFATQLRDKQGRPFRIHFDNLPKFLTPSEIPTGAGMLSAVGPEQPARSISTDTTLWPHWEDDEFTNWPLRDWTVNRSEWEQFRETTRQMIRDIKPRRQPMTGPALPSYLLFQ